MDLTGSTSFFSSRVNFHLPFRHLETAKTLPPSYLHHLNQVTEFLGNVFLRHLSHWPKEHEIIEFKSRLYRHYQFKNKQVLDQEGKPLNSQCAQIIKTLHNILEYCHIKPSQGLDSKGQNTSELITKTSASILTTNNFSTSIPNEIWLNILTFYNLDHWQSIGRFAMTCKQFYSIVKTPNFFKLFLQSHPVLFSTIPSPISRQLLSHTKFNPTKLDETQAHLTDNDLRVLADQGSQLEVLSFRGSHFTPAGLADLLKKCPNLYSLEFRECHTSKFDGYMTVVSLYAKQLKHLKVVDCMMTDQSLLAFSCDVIKLRSFEYENTLGRGVITDYGLHAFFTMANDLEVIKLSGCPKVTQMPIIYYISDDLSGLSDNSKASDRKGTKLKELSFSYCGTTQNLFFDSIATYCPQLERLELGFNSSQCELEKPQKSQALLTLIKQSKLQSLKLSECSYLTPQIINEMVESLPFLTYLELYECIPLTMGLFAALAKCPNLKSFKFKPTINSSNPTLVTFLSEQHLEALRKNCSHLEILSLMNCQILERDLVKSLKNWNLKTLQLVACGSFGDSLLTALSKDCPKLEHLEVHITKLTPIPNPLNDASIEKLAHNCRSLKTLCLSAPSSKLRNDILPWQLSAQSLHHLASYCPDLSRLTLSHLNLISEDAKIKKITTEILTSFHRSCVKIVDLGLTSSRATDEQLLSFLLPYRHQLLSLNLENSKLNSDFYQKLAAFSKLRFLILENNSICLSSFKVLLESLPFLRFVDIKGCEMLAQDLDLDKENTLADFPFVYVKRETQKKLTST